MTPDLQVTRPSLLIWVSRWWPWLAVAGGAGTLAIVLASVGHATTARTTMVVLSTILAASSAVPAVRETLRDRASLQPVTWAIWTILTATAAAASAVDGDYPATIFALVGTATCGTVAIVAARHGRWRPSRIDLLCFLLAVTGIAAWQTVHEPDLAIAAACIGDFVGLIPTLRHAWTSPGEVPTSVFVLIAAGGVCTVIAAHSWTAAAVAYPLYVVATTAAVALLTVVTMRPPHMHSADVPAEPASAT